MGKIGKNLGIFIGKAKSDIAIQKNKNKRRKGKFTLSITTFGYNQDKHGYGDVVLDIDVFINQKDIQNAMKLIHKGKIVHIEGPVFYVDPLKDGTWQYPIVECERFTLIKG